ncbi:T9SS type A sorting domain-containing protein [Mangrovibacterium sp.]|uniref:T9SS type A sorting domain-containing protein n=1 Tax=Mangrovibacterium sp. TaxID=1961364 RepID=UPI00356453FF
MKTILFSFILVAVVWSQSQAQSYPFTLSADLQATINLDPTSQETFNNLLLGTNTHDLAKSEGQEFVKSLDPITIRFPHGLFSNWYDWEQDKARLYGDEKITYTKDDGMLRTVEVGMLSSINTMDASNLYVGIDELNTLNDEKKSATGKGYDMMWTFNMSADGTDFDNGSPVSVARYNDLIKRGFEVKAIEMGNENFYPSQRSSIIPNTSDYIARAKSIYNALKALDPALKLSVPLERKSVPANTGWNTDLTKTTDYFDAVSVHTYVGYDPDDNSNSNEAYGVALTAREHLRKTIDDYSKVVAPDKPIWLTEWGVKSGGSNAVSALGMADCYIFMSENQDTYERANWFSVNGKLNSWVVWETYFDVKANKEKERIKYPLQKTLFGSTYEIIRSVFENSTLLKSSVDVPNLVDGVKAVNARVVLKDGKTSVIVVNLSNQEVPFNVNVRGAAYTGGFVHKTMAFSSMDEERALGFDVDPLSLEKEGSGAITLPKLSVNTIELTDVGNVTSLRDRPSIANLVVSPNPNRGLFHIQLNENSQANYRLLSLSGSVVLSGSFFAKAEIRVDRYTAGIYLLEVTTDHSRSVHKLILD